jgi:hypothetical protein
MKSFGFVHIFLVLILLLAYQCTQAQDYVMTTRGDSVAGRLKLFNYGPDKKVLVTTNDKKKISYTVTDVHRIVYNGEEYRPQKGPAGYSFMKIQKEGYLSLYAYQPEKLNTYDGQLLVKRDGRTLDVPNLNFKKAMKKFLEDCPAVSDKIEEGDFGRKDLTTIIDEYNRCIDLRTQVRAAETVKEIESVKKSEPWMLLEQRVRESDDFAGKSDAIEMIGEIRGKIRRSEKVPNFMIEGLRNSLKDTGLHTELEQALAELR